VANFSGFPAMTVPLHRNATGLPVGPHFLARGGDEATLFQLAGQLERAQPWFDVHPEVPVGT
jgi:amidase